ncbi:MAG: ATP-binding cassette domain-containing protein [Syntrophaceae bacterium]|nr:ATP-binding cassette domain-containing protein [Deltaproteobacteria bacterium]
MSTGTPLYLLKNISFHYKERFELNIPELSIDSGASIGLIGPNGGGKSTLLRIVGFLLHPQEGEIYYNGEKVTRETDGPRREVTTMLQEPYLLKRSVFDNIAYGLKMRGERQGTRERVYESLEMVGLDPAGFASRSWFELSGGEAQRVSLASRLILKPRVLILDEPTASVDEASGRLIKEAVLQCREKYGTTLLIASHDQIWLNTIASDIRKVSLGRVWESAAGNLIAGPWKSGENGLYLKKLPDGQTIFATKPPEPERQGMIEATDIIISTMPPERVSAQNILNAGIMNMRIEKESGMMVVGLDAGGLQLTSRITQHAARSLGLFPGEKVWVVFKATSIKWS